MCKKIITAILLSAAVALTGCTNQNAEETVVLSQQGKEIAAVAEPNGSARVRQMKGILLT